MTTFNESVQSRIVESLLEPPGNKTKLKDAGIECKFPVDVVALMSYINTFHMITYHIILNFREKYIILPIYKNLFDYVSYQFAESNQAYVIFEDTLIINKLYIDHFDIPFNSKLMFFKNPATNDKIEILTCSTDMKEKFYKIKLGKTDSSKDMPKQNNVKEGVMSNTKFLLLMGGSGCGKTTLAMNLESFDPNTYHRPIEYGTREIRDGEVDGFDYFFITKDELSKLEENGELIEVVEYQFKDSYGCNINQIKEGKINVLVLSIEGFITIAERLKKFYPESDTILVNIINDCELDVKRAGRDPLQEERFNRSVLLHMLDNVSVDTSAYSFTGVFNNPKWKENIKYHELHLSDLKKIRNSKNDCLEYFYGLFN